MEPFTESFPYFYLVFAGAILLMLDGGLLYTEMPWAHRLGLRLKERRTPADPSLGEALNPEVVKTAGDVGAATLTDGALSSWSDRAHFGFVYGGLAKSSDPSGRRMGVPVTTLQRVDGDALVTSTYVRLGPLAMFLAFVGVFVSPDFPWSMPLLVLAMGGALYGGVTWVCVRHLSGLHELADAVVGASTVAQVTRAHDAGADVSPDPEGDGKGARARQHDLAHRDDVPR